MNLCGIIFARKECDPLRKETINHERIHSAQIVELLVIFFYLFYFVEWIIRWIATCDQHDAYYQISFEKEAYDNMDDLTYLKHRKYFAWIKYFYVKSI
jgi:hypothetical protein